MGYENEKLWIFCLATRWVAFFTKAQNDKFLTTMTPCLVILSAAKLSIKLKCILNSVDIFATATPCNPLGR